eukprot:6175089-Pleurochrysis_carterae.AAC.3
MDHSGAINLAHDPVRHAKSKHIHRRELTIRELIADGTIKLKYVKSETTRWTFSLSHWAASLSRSTAPSCLAFANRLKIRFFACSLSFRAWRL